MEGDFLRKFIGTRAIVFDLRHAPKRVDQLGNRSGLEAQSHKEIASVGAEQIKMTRAASVRRLTRRIDKRFADSTPPHRIDNVERANQRRIDLRLDANRSNCLLAVEREQVARGWRFYPGGDHPAGFEKCPKLGDIARLLDYELSLAMLA